MLREWARRIGVKAADDALNEFVSSGDLDRRIRLIVEDRVSEILDGDQQKRLTMTGWRLVLVSAIKRYWPDLDDQTAACWMLDYASAYQVGRKQWTPETAKLLAREYVSEFGEAA